MSSAGSPDSAAEFGGRFESALEATLARYATDAPITPMTRYHFGYDAGLTRRGKRLRPRLLATVTEEEGGSLEDALPAACAIEILHNFTLVHDDIEDHDRVRHNRETVWTRWGVAHGINTGDSLCAIAYLALLGESPRLPAERELAMVRALHEAQYAICAGQSSDIGFETAAHVSMSEYMAMIGNKTAALFGAACALGALAAGAAPERAAAYARFGRAYGAAFQIEDDVLGTWGDTAVTGKPSGADVARRKWVFPIVWALGGPPSAARETIAQAYASGAALDPATVQRTIAALDTLGARAAAEAAALAKLDEAEAIAREHALDRRGGVHAFLRATLGRAA
ncbi:MAG: polyprenyl synthetase family protein [Candidatus Velthaea sp.]|jgi:geranylgeranyl diphosphate synthase type I